MNKTRRISSHIKLAIDITADNTGSNDNQQGRINQQANYTMVKAVERTRSCDETATLGKETTRKKDPLLTSSTTGPKRTTTTVQPSSTIRASLLQDPLQFKTKTEGKIEGLKKYGLNPSTYKLRQQVSAVDSTRTLTGQDLGPIVSVETLEATARSKVGCFFLFESTFVLLGVFEAVVHKS